MRAFYFFLFLSFKNNIFFYFWLYGFPPSLLVVLFASEKKGDIISVVKRIAEEKNLLNGFALWGRALLMTAVYYDLNSPFRSVARFLSFLVSRPSF